MSDPIVIIGILCTPVGVVILWQLWRRGTGVPEDHWYSMPNTRRGVGNSRHTSNIAPLASSPISAPVEDVTPELIDVCEKALFCWDYWSTGKSGVDLQDIFEVRDLPAALRETIAKAKGNA